MRLDFIKKITSIKILISSVVVILMLTALIVYINIPSYVEDNGKICYKGIAYESTLNEFKYEALSFGGIIGRTEDQYFVYKIKGQASNKYIVVKGFMNPPLVYRNVSSAPIENNKLTIEKIAIEYKGFIFNNDIYTKDKAIIGDLMKALSSPVKSGKEPGKIIYNYDIKIASKELKGINYSVNVKVDKNKNVYVDEIGEKGEVEDNLTVGKNFTSWINSINKH